MISNGPQKLPKQRLSSSTLDCAVRVLCAKAQGLFLYARLLEGQLKSEADLQEVSETPPPPVPTLQAATYAACPPSQTSLSSQICQTFKMSTMPIRWNRRLLRYLVSLA